MSILAIVGVIVSSAAMFVVLSGFSGLKDYSLEFISFISPDLKITSVKGKSFEFTDKISSFLEDENISYSLSYEDKALISINENIRIVALRGIDQGFPKRSVDSMLYQGRWFNLESNEVVVGLDLAYDLGVSTLDIINPIKLYAPKAGKGQIFSERDIYKSINWNNVSNLMRHPAWVFDTRSIIQGIDVKASGLNFWQIGDGLR